MQLQLNKSKCNEDSEAAGAHGTDASGDTHSLSTWIGLYKALILFCVPFVYIGEISFPGAHRWHPPS